MRERHYPRDCLFLRVSRLRVLPVYVYCLFVVYTCLQSTSPYALPTPLRFTIAPSSHESLRVALRLSITSFELPRYTTTPLLRPQRFMPVRTKNARKHHGTVPTRGRIPMSPKLRQHPPTISLSLSTPDPDASFLSNSEPTGSHIGAEHVPCTGQLTKPRGSSPRSPDACHQISPRSRPPLTFSHRQLNPTSTIAQHRLTSAITRPPSVF